MSSFTGAPRIVKGGIVLVNPDNAAVIKVISLQYNPDTLSRTLQVQATSGEGSAHRSEPLRLTGPPVETYKVDVELDAADQLELGDPTAISEGIQPALAALETLLYPTSTSIIVNSGLAALGTIEISPMQAPLTLFVWNKNRVVPVRITDFSITEEIFDANLNPLRAKVSLGMRVLNIDDLGFTHPGSSLYMSYQQNKERLANMFAFANLNTLGINSI